MKEIYEMLRDPIDTKNLMPFSQSGRGIYRVHHSMEVKRLKDNSYILVRRKGHAPNAVKLHNKNLLSNSFVSVDLKYKSIADDSVTLSH